MRMNGTIKKDKKHGISGCMVVKDEEQDIGDAISSLKKVCDEVIVVDTGSNDNTKFIAKRMGCHVFSYQWDKHFGRVRNFSISKARFDWVLYIDADETLDMLLQENIHSLIDTEDIILYTFNIYDKIVPNSSGGKPVRLFPSVCRFNNKGVIMLHTGPPVYNKDMNKIRNIRVVDTCYNILHNPSEHLLLHPEKILSRVGWDVESRVRNGCFLKYLCLGVINFNREFFNRFIMRKGFRDGYVGMKWILLRCCYRFLLYFFIGLKPEVDKK